jgi:hypothetical protein
MKKIVSLSFLAFLLFTVNMIAQSVTGKLTDVQQQPIAYANIQIGSAYSAVSNEEGVFVVQLPAEPDGDKVTFSCLGFESLQVPLSEFKGGTYVLKDQVTNLAEVFVTNEKLTPEQILARVLQNAPKNYTSDTSKQTFFLRSSTNSKMMDGEFELVKSSLEKKSTLKELNKDIEELMKRYKNQTSKDFSEYYGYMYEQKGLSKLSVEKAIELKNKEKDVSSDQLMEKVTQTIKKHLEPGATYKLQSGWFTLEDSLSLDKPKKDKKTGHKTASLRSSIVSISSSLNKFYTNEDLDFLTEFKRYTYTLEGYSTFNDETIYVIDFQPKKSSANYYGKIYVNASDFAVVKLEYNLVDGKNLHNVNLKLLLGVKMREDREKVAATFSKNEAGHYAANFVKKQSATYAYISRSLKFTKNKVDKKEETRMLKMDVMVEIDQLNTEELFIFDKKGISNDEFNGVAETAEYNLNYISKYDASVWKDYNVLAPVEAIKNYN